MISELTHGLGHLGRGIGFIFARPRLALLGMVPPLIVSALMVGLLISFGLFGLEPLTAAATGWVPESWRTAAQVVMGILVMVIAIGLAAVTFSSITLLVGTPIYEKISEAVEQACGGAPLAPEERLAASIVRSIGQSLTVIALSLLLAIPVFLVGLVPVVGGIIGVIAGVVVGGTLIVVELIGSPYDRRGRRRLGDKFGAAKGRRMVALGFGIPVFWLFSLPLVSVVLFPAATAGATLLARDLLGESTDPA